MIFDFNDIASAYLTDVENDMYTDALREELDPELIQSFNTLAKTAAVSDSLSSGRPLYAISFYDDQDNEKLKAVVTDTRCVLINSEVFSGESFKDILDRIEQEYCLDDALWEREPSSNYFALMKDAESADIYENVEDHFSSSRCAVLSEELIEQLKKSAGSIEIIGKAENFEIRYALRVYSKDESSLYVFYADDEGKTYTEFGYEVKGIPLNNWISIMEKALPRS